MNKNFEDLTAQYIASMDDEQLREYAGGGWDIDELRAERERCRKILAAMS